MTADIDFDARPDVPTYEPHLTIIAPSCRELDADRVIATYQRSIVVRTMERHALTMDLVDELDALLEAYLSKARRNR